MRPDARRTAVAACLLLVAVSFGCSGGYETPEACFAGAKEAVKNKDPLAFCRCITPESQDSLAGAMVVMGGMMKMMSGMASMGGPEAVEKANEQFGPINAVLEKHGVDEDVLKKAAQLVQQTPDPKALQSAADAVSNKPVFIAEMIGAMEGLSQGPSFAEKMSEEYAGDLKDLKIEGDTATAKTGGTAGGQEIEFRKIDQGWLIHIDPTKLSGGAAAPPA